MELNGSYRYPGSEDSPRIIEIGPMIVFPRPGVVWVERIGGDLEDATPEETKLITEGKPVPWILPNLGKVERETVDGENL